MKRKRKTKIKGQVIIPLVDNCHICGSKVLNHHFLCDRCWGDKQRQKNLKKYVKKKKIINEPNKYTFNITSNSTDGIIHILDSIVEHSKKYKYKISLSKSVLKLLDDFEEEYQNQKI